MKERESLVLTGSSFEGELGEEAMTVDELKRVLSARIRSIAGVKGVGTRNNVLTIYVSQDSARLRRQVSNLVQQEAHGRTQISFCVTGVFRAAKA